MTLEQALSPATTLCCHQHLSGKKALFELIAKLASDHSQNIKYQQVIQLLQAREKLGSTAIGFGVAIPHARIPGLTCSLAVLIKLDQPVVYNDDGNESADIIFSLLVPEDATEEHLQLLSSIAKKLSETSYRDALKAATNNQQLYEAAIQ